MAGDWIKVERATSRKTEVVRVALELRIHPDHAFGLCVRFWFWCDENLSRAERDKSVTETSGERDDSGDCHAYGVTIQMLDLMVEHPGFGQAMVSAGWIIDCGDHIAVPNFDRHLSQSSKARALAFQRKQKERRHADVTLLSRAERDISVTKEKRREEKNKDNPPAPLGVNISEIIFPQSLNNPEAKTALNEWLDHKSAIRKPYKNNTSIQKLLGIWSKFGTRPFVDAVNKSIASNYQGLIEPIGATTHAPTKRDPAIFDAPWNRRPEPEAVADSDSGYAGRG